MDPASGKIYVSSGDGVEIFDPVKQTFSHFSDYRVDDLAFAPTGELWATSWPKRGDIVKFDAKGRPHTQLRLTDAADSLVFGKSGTALDGLLFISSQAPLGSANGANLVMVDLATLQTVNVASSGPLAEALAISADGRVLIAHSHQIDVLMPATAPAVVRTNPANNIIVPLPMGTMTVTFDHDMSTVDPTLGESVLNPLNFGLWHADGTAVAITGVTYEASSRTVKLSFESLAPDYYTLAVAQRVRSSDGLAMKADYVTQFIGVEDFSSLVRLDFLDTRADRGDGTLSFDVKVTNIADYDLRTPLMLVLDPGRYFQGSAQSVSVSGDGLWLLDVGAGLVNNTLAVGQATVVRTITLNNQIGQRADLGYGLYAIPYQNLSPQITTTPLTTATAGEAYSYTVQAQDPDGVALSYVLIESPAGMSLDKTSGVLSWAPSARDPAQSNVVLRAYDTRGGFGTQSFEIDVAGGNAAPVIEGNPAVIDLYEGQPYELPIVAHDPEGTVLSNYADHLPAGAVFDSDAGTLNWTPGFDQAGEYKDVRFFVTDGINTSSQAVTFIVHPVNAPPVIGGVPDRTVRQGDPLRIKLSATDVDNGQLTFGSNFLPGGATLNPLTGIFEWTPGYYQTGDFTFDLSVSDGQTVSNTATTIHILNVNAAPVFDRLDGWNLVEGQPIGFRAFAFDPDNPGYVPQDRLGTGELAALEGTDPTVTVTAQGLPPGATFDSSTWLFNWTPDNTQAGQYTIHLTATDDGNGTGIPLTTTVDVPITVYNANRAPVVAPIANVTVDRGQSIDVPLDFSDPDGDVLTLGANGLPRFAQIVTLPGGSSVLRVSPDAQDRGDYVVTLTATDDGDGGGIRSQLAASQSFVISANSPSEAPVLAEIGDKVAVFGQTLSFTIRASDLDQDPLTFAAQGLPTGATITPGIAYGTAVFAWTPDATQGGNYDVGFTVTDNGNNGAGAIGNDQQTIRITARATNAAPLLLPIGNQTLQEGAPFQLQIQALDTDGDALTYGASGLPPGARLDAHTGLLSWTPNYFMAGHYGGLLISVSDGPATMSETITLDVANTDRAPILAGIPPVGGQEDRLLQFSLIANDPDSDVIVYSLVGYQFNGQAQPGQKPAGVFFDGTKGRFEWTPTFEQAGDYTFTFKAADLAGASDTLDIVVRIANENRTPVIALNNHQTALGSPLNFTIVGSDPDKNETLRFSAEGLPQGATLDAVSGEFSWSPGAGQAGDYLVLVSLSDGKSTTVSPLALRATLTPELPTAVIEQTPSFPVIPGQTVNVTLLADAFSGVVARHLYLNGQELTLDSRGHAVITAGAPGTYTISAIVTDRDGLTGHTEGILKVREAADTAAPLVNFDPHLIGAQIITGADIVARVVDSNLDQWRLEIARAGSDQYTLLAEGRNTFDGSIFQLDPARYDTGFYQLRLTAIDVAGRVGEALVDLELAASQKQGQYLRSETDFSFTLGGHTLDFTRRYDSLDAATQGSFGFGWNLNLRDVRVESDVPLTGSEASGVYNPLRMGSRLYIDTPTGERLGFTFTPQQTSGKGYAYWAPAWVADQANGWLLKSVDTKLQKGADRFYDLQTGAAYNPASLADERAQYELHFTRWHDLRDFRPARHHRHRLHRWCASRGQ